MEEKRSLDFEIKKGSRINSDQIKKMVQFHGERAGNDVARKSQTSYGFSAVRQTWCKQQKFPLTALFTQQTSVVIFVPSRRGLERT